MQIQVRLLGATKYAAAATSLPTRPILGQWDSSVRGCAYARPLAAFDAGPMFFRFITAAVESGEQSAARIHAGFPGASGRWRKGEGRPFFPAGVDSDEAVCVGRAFSEGKRAINFF